MAGHKRNGSCHPEYHQASLELKSVNSLPLAPHPCGVDQHFVPERHHRERDRARLLVPVLHVSQQVRVPQGVPPLYADVVLGLGDLRRCTVCGRWMCWLREWGGAYVAERIENPTPEQL